ncbi:hypothetical protein DFJ73DRAFT_854697, partial [Zopfochytrium polystomum]
MSTAWLSSWPRRRATSRVRCSSSFSSAWTLRISGSTISLVRCSKMPTTLSTFSLKWALIHSFVCDWSDRAAASRRVSNARRRSSISPAMRLRRSSAVRVFDPKAAAYIGSVGAAPGSAAVAGARRGSPAPWAALSLRRASEAAKRLVTRSIPRM